MIRFNLGYVLKLLEAREGRRITLKELSERSGCDRNVLSRMRSVPDVIPSATVIDKMVQFLFNELKDDDQTKHEALIKEIIHNFVSIFPDDQKYWKQIPKGIQDNPSVSLDDVWDIYNNQASS
jgi:transcriptional regulator with XRE-family HTH domain